MRRRGWPALLVGALAAALVLLAGTAVLWSRDRARRPAASIPAPPATRPSPDPATLQVLLDELVEAGARRDRAGPDRSGDLAGGQWPG